MRKYQYSEIIDKANELENINKEIQKEYLASIIDKTVTEPFPSHLIIDVSVISDYMFYGCNNLSNGILTIPKTITSIGSYAFYGCGLTDVYLYTTTPPSIGNTALINADLTHPTIHVPVGSEDAYKSATNWSRFGSTIVGDIVIESEE